MIETIIAALVAILPPLLGLVAGWWQRRQKLHDDPLYQHRRRCAQAEADVARGAAGPASVHGVDDLAELERLQKRTGAARR